MTGNNCKITCWLAALVAGWFVGLLFWVGAGWGFFWALIAGVIVCFLAGMFLPRFFCSDEQALSDGAAATSNASSASATPSSEPKPAPEPAPEATPAPAPAATAAPEAPTPAGSAPVIKPSADLPGQNELAERKGSWSYEGDSAELSPEAAPETATDTAAEITAEAPSQPEPEAAPAAAPAADEAAFGLIKASTKLPGQEELAARKGTWTYQGEAREVAQKSGSALTGQGAPATSDSGTQPQGLSAARAEGSDNLKMIKGVGPKLEKLLNSMGFFHFDQIAGWTASDVAWVDENLVGFKGRVSRDAWVDQAKALAAGEETEFAKRAKIEGLYG